MRNVTITLDEATARWVRVEAARQDTSVSRLIRGLLEENMRQHQAYELAMERFLSRPAIVLRDRGAYPTRDEVHDRAALR